MVERNWVESKTKSLCYLKTNFKNKLFRAGEMAQVLAAKPEFNPGTHMVVGEN